MNKEYEAIAAKFAGEIYDATSVENAHGIVRSAVESCYKLANKPSRGLGKWVSNLAEDEPESNRWQSETTEYIEALGPKVTHWMPLPPAPQEAKA